MIQLRKLVSAALTVSTALAMSGLGMVASTAYAAPLTESQISLSDSRGATSSSYVINFKVATADATGIKGFKFVFSNRASGSVTKPDNWSAGSATLTSIFKNSVTDVTGTFAINVTDAGTGIVTVEDSTGTGSVAQGDLITVTLGGITNASAVVSGGNECDSPSIANTDTCYIRIGTYNNGTHASLLANTGLFDSSVATYTVVTPVTATVTVDPSLTFTITAVSSGSIATNDSFAVCGTEVTSTATTLPFGNLGVGITNSKCTQHDLKVATNANFGYDTFVKFLGAAAATNMMQGVIGGGTNNIDPYTGTFGTPTAFSVTPSGGTANVNTGWLGVRSNTIGGFSGSNLFAGPAVNNTAAHGDAVMTKSSPDIGTTATYVTYKIAVNALQPADTYTGTVIYNVVAKY